MNLKQCKVKLERNEVLHVALVNELYEIQEEREYLERKDEHIMALLDDLKTENKGLRNLIMQLEGDE